MIAAAGFLLLQAISLGGRLQSGVVVRPESVTVGSPFEVVVRVRAPKDAVIEFPETPDSGGAVEAVDPVQVTSSPDTTFTERTAVYRATAWDVGSQPIHFQDVVVREPIGIRRLRLSDIAVTVTSVLPADSAERVPKPVRDIFAFGPPWWIWLLLALALAALLALARWLWLRHRRRARPPIEPFTDAEREFGRIAALGLVSAGEKGLHVALMAEVLRAYLARVVPGARTALTTSELVAVLRGRSAVPLTRLAALLNSCDAAKFAGRALDAERALQLGREAQAIVAAIHAQLTTAPTEQAA